MNQKIKLTNKKNKIKKANINHKAIKYNKSSVDIRTGKTNKPNSRQTGLKSPKKGELKNGQLSPLAQKPRKFGRKKYDDTSSIKETYKKNGRNEYCVDSLSSFKEYLKFDPGSIIKIRYLDKIQPKIKEIIASSNIPKDRISFKMEKVLDENVDLSLEHIQTSCSFLMWVKVRTYDLSDLIKEHSCREKSLVVALDHISDPRNLGAIIRSCSFFGVSHVIVPQYRQVLLTDSVLATSMGGLSLVKVVEVVNLASSLKKLKEEGYWIIGTTMGGSDYKELVGFYDKVVLVLGSEDKGMSSIIQNLSDRTVSIVSNAEQKIDSLNVSVAAGILISGFSSK